MTIGELAARFGLRPHVLRHWEATGLLDPARRVNGRRRYSGRDIARVAMIVQGKAAGLSLEQLRAVLEAPSLTERRGPLREYHRVLEKRIRQMEASKELIEHALVCPSQDFTQCPAFRRLAEKGIRHA